MEELSKKAEFLSRKIIRKYGSAHRFAKASGLEVGGLLDMMEGKPITEKYFEVIKRTYKYTEPGPRTDLITPALIDELKRSIMRHPEAIGDNYRPSFKTFFLNNPEWQNTYFSEIANGTRKKVTNKVKNLCEKLEIDFENFV